MTRFPLFLAAALALAACSGNKEPESFQAAALPAAPAGGFPPAATPAPADGSVAEVRPAAVEPGAKRAAAKATTGTVVAVKGSDFAGPDYPRDKCVIGDYFHMAHFGAAKATVTLPAAASKVVLELEGWEYEGEYPLANVALIGRGKNPVNLTILAMEPIRGRDKVLEKDFEIPADTYEITASYAGATDGKTRSRLVIRQIRFLP